MTVTAQTHCKPYKTCVTARSFDERSARTGGRTAAVSFSAMATMAVQLLTTKTSQVLGAAVCQLNFMQYSAILF